MFSFNRPGTGARCDVLTGEETTARYAAAAFTFVAASLILLALVFRWHGNNFGFDPESLLILIAWDRLIAHAVW